MKTMICAVVMACALVVPAALAGAGPSVSLDDVMARMPIAAMQDQIVSYCGMLRVGRAPLDGDEAAARCVLRYLPTNPEAAVELSADLRQKSAATRKPLPR